MLYSLNLQTISCSNQANSTRTAKLNPFLTINPKLLEKALDDNYYKYHHKIARDCLKEDYIVFAAKGNDSKKLFSSTGKNNYPIKLLQDFDHLEAARINACKVTLEELAKEEKITIFAKHGCSEEKPRLFPTFSYVLDDDNYPNPKFQEYWAHEVTHADAPSKKGLSGKNIRIGVLDTGVNPKVPQFKDQIKGFHDFVYNKKSAYDDDGHGTFVIGIINKVVPDAEVYVYKIHDYEGLNYLTGILGALDRSIADNLDVINNSWGLSEPRELEGMTWSDGNKILREALERVARSGIIIEASSGNHSYYTLTKDAEHLPEGGRYSISTGATRIDGEIADFSDLDADLFAPGDMVYSTSNEKDHRFWSGTSFSGPFVTAAIAVIQDHAKQHHQKLGYEQILDILKNSAKRETSTIVLKNGTKVSHVFRALDYSSLVSYLFR